MKLMRCLAGVVRSSLLLCTIAYVLASAAFTPTAEAGANRKPKVLIAHAASNVAWATDVQSKIVGSGLFDVVDVFNAATGTPTLAQFQQYDAALVFSDQFFQDAATLGTNLAQYVDAGGGVVLAPFANASRPLAGAWAAAYQVIVPAGQSQPADSLGTIANQNHSTVIGVEQLSATLAFGSSGALAPGAITIASWAGGRPLVAVSGTKPNRADINFYPPSSDVRADFWTGDGTKLMVNTLLYVMRPRVLIIDSSASPAYTADIVAKVKGTNLFSVVDSFNGVTGTPTLTQLQAYDAALVANQSPWNNRTALGNVLADFVDAGGGVVQTVFTTGGIANSNLGGRWTGTYDIISFSTSTFGSATLGTVSYPNHPIMAGVGTFDGGTNGARPTNTSLNSGGLYVARWSDGKTLAAVSTKYANRVDLGFWAVSGAVFAGSWNPATDGAKLLGNSLIYTIKPYVACAAADLPNAGDVVAKLTASRRFSGVGSIDANAATPALATLSPFNAVATWSNFSYANTTTMGNTLADYVDAGGGVVTAMFAVGTAQAPGGRWITQGYEITPSPLPVFITGQQSLGTVLETSHPLASFVRKFDGTTTSFRQNATPLLRGRTIMKWTDGKMLTSVHNFKKRADLGYWPPSNNGGNNGWNQRTDGTWMTANALEFVVRVKPCPGDFNGDGVVEDSDFVLFAGYYDALVDPRGDLNGDGLTEDSDFVIFAGGYDALVCP